MKSIFQNKEFASFYNEMSGRYGQAYKRYVVTPTLFRFIKSLKGKAVLELGCGNGFCAQKFLRKGAKEVILLDISKHNLEYARQLVGENPRVRYVCQDATKKWTVRSGTVKLVYSDMMLNEVSNIRTPIREAYRVLAPGGLFLVAVTHPAWDLFEYVKATYGNGSQIIETPMPYFEKGYSTYLMGTASQRPKPGCEYKKTYKVEHYQRTIQDYHHEFRSAGFVVDRILEPKCTKKLLLEFEGYKDLSEHPISLLFIMRK